jgi:hypothetical protein
MTIPTILLQRKPLKIIPELFLVLFPLDILARYDRLALTALRFKREIVTAPFYDKGSPGVTPRKPMPGPLPPEGATSFVAALLATGVLLAHSMPQLPTPC